MKAWVRTLYWLPVWLIGGVLTLLATFVLVIQLPVAKQRIASVVERVVNEQLNGTLEIGTLEGNFLSTLRFNDVLIRQEADTLIYLNTLELNYNLPSLLKGRLILHHIGLHAPYLVLHQSADSTWNVTKLLKTKPETTEAAREGVGEMPFLVRVDCLLLTNGRVTIQALNPSLPRNIEQLNLDAAFELDEGRQLLNLNGFHAQALQPDLRLDTLHFNLLRQGDWIQLTHLTLITPLNRLVGQATLDVSNKRKSTLSFRTAPLHTEEWAAFLPEDLAIGVHPTLLLDGASEGERLQVDLLLDNLDQSLAARLVGDHLVDYLLQQDGVTVSYDLNLSLRYFDIDRWTGLTQLNTALNGGLSVEGRGLEPNTLQAKARLHLEGLHLYQQALDDVRVEATYDAGDLKADLNTSGGFGWLIARPVIKDLLGQPSYALELEADMSAPGTLLDTSLHLPPFRFQTALRGRGFDLEQLTVDHARLLTQSMELQLGGRYEAGGRTEALLTLNLSDASDVRVLAGMDSLELKGTLTLHLQGGKEALFADLLAVLTDLSVGQQTVDSLRLATSGTLKGTQTLDLTTRLDADALRTEWRSVMELGDALGVRIAGLKLGYEHLLWEQDSGWATILVDKDRYLVNDVNLSSPAPSGTQRISLHGSIDRRGDQALQLRLDSLNLQHLLPPFAPELEVEGLFNLQANLTGPAASPQLHTTLRLEQGRYKGIELGELSGTVAHIDQQLRLGGQLRLPESGSLQVKGYWPTDFRIDSLHVGLAPTRQTPLNGELHLESLPLSLVRPFVPVDALDGTLEGHIDLSGSLAEPHPLGAVYLKQGSVAMNRFGVHYQPIEAGVRVDGRSLQLDTLLVKSRKGDVQANGNYMDNRSIINVNFNRFRPIDHRQFNLEMDGQTKLTWQPDSARFDGELTIPRAEIHLPALMALMGQPGPPKLPEPLLVKARAARDTPSNDVPASVATDTLVKPVNPLLNRLQGRMRVFIPRNTWIKNDNMRLEVAGDLEVVKEADDPELFGQIDVVRGQYNLYGKVFVIQSGTVTFNGGKGFKPDLALQATYTFRDVERLQRRLLIDVSGSLEAPKLAFSLDDETLTEGDALSYVLIGMPIEAIGEGSMSGLGQASDMAGMAQSAAFSLLTSQLTKVLGQAFNLDYISYKNERSTGAGSFVVGKYLTNNLFVSYERNMGTAIEPNSQVAAYEMTLEYELLRFLFFQLTSTPLKNGFDVVFKVTVP